MHIINDAALDALGASSKMNNGRAFLEHLRRIGRMASRSSTALISPTHSRFAVSL